MRMRIVFFSLLAMTLWSSALSAQPASPLNYDCQAYLTRPDVVPKAVAGDSDPWQCSAPSLLTTTATHWQRNSLEYCRLATSIYDIALKAADLVAATHPRRQWIVVLDGDETVLDNSFFEREHDHCGGPFRDAQWESWVHANLARDVPGAAIFTQEIHRLGGLVAIITNRIAKDDPMTQYVLRHNRIWFDFEIGMAETADKANRWRQAIDRLGAKFGGHPIAVLWIGDQVSDLAVTDRNGRIVRAMTEKDAGDGIGRNLFLVPNAMYGNWQANPDR